MGLAMSLNLDIDSLPPEKVEAAITRLEAVKAQRAAENKLLHYRPHPKQVAFHDAGAKHRERLLMCANRFGKTMCGAVDPNTSVVTIERYTVVDDFGRTINPLLLEGQVHGGIVQGIGQALLEHSIYEPYSVNLLSGTCMDYAMPRADAVPFSRSQPTPFLRRPTRWASRVRVRLAPTVPRRRSSTLSSTLSSVVLNCATSICQRRR